jgi:NADH-ubiquinone oxidoreductase chain 6
LSILIQTFCITIITGILLPSFWFSYILILVFLGGLLVLFIYVSALASNQQINLSSPKILLFFPLIITLVLSVKITPLKLSLITDNPPTIESFLWGFSSSISFFFAFLIVYLFITLLAVVKIIKWWGGSLRPIN